MLIRRIAFLIWVLSLLPFSAPARAARHPVRKPAEEAPYFGLPVCLSLAYRGDPDYLPYDLKIDGNQFVPPISDRMDIEQDGKPVPDFSSLQSSLVLGFFPSRHYAYVPASGRIISQKEAQGEVRWSFPEGTTFIHEVFLDSKGKGLDFSDLREVRVERMVGGIFRFGVYDAAPTGEAGCSGGSLALRTHPVAKLQRIASPESAFGNVTISYRPLSPSSCLDCHDMEGATAERVQPCAFEDPANDDMAIHASIPEWIRAYRKKFGHSPLK